MKKLNNKYAIKYIKQDKEERYINVSYDPREHNTYTFRCFDKNIEIGNFVVVPTDTRHKMTVCRVTAVNTTAVNIPKNNIKNIIDKVRI